MKLDYFINTAKTTEEGVEIWLSDKTFNGFLSAASKIRINGSGRLELIFCVDGDDGCVDNVYMEISLKHKFCSKNSRAHAELKLLYLNVKDEKTKEYSQIGYFFAPEISWAAKIL